MHRKRRPRPRAIIGMCVGNTRRFKYRPTSKFWFTEMSLSSNSSSTWSDSSCTKSDSSTQTVVGFQPKFYNHYKPSSNSPMFERHQIVYDHCPVQRVLKKLPNYYPLSWEQKKLIENRLNWENERRERV